MSVNNTETAEEFLGNAADSYGLASFSSLMDTMVEQEEAEETVEDVVSSATFGGANEGASDGVEFPTAGDDYEDGSDGGEDSSTDGSEGDDGTPDGDSEFASASDGGSAAPATWTAEPSTLVVELGKMSTQIEENLSSAFQQQAYEDAKGEYGEYFDALAKHPRMLVGVEVPVIGGDGTETLQSSADARDWQEAVKSILVDEIRGRAEKEMEDSQEFLRVTHQAISLFQQNQDLIPGAKGFDVDLANRFTELAAPYEIRVDGTLKGYSIDVQPLINSLRAQKPAVKAPAPVKKSVASKPQKGITSKAGSSGSNKEDYSALFGTLGLPNLAI